MLYFKHNELAEKYRVSLKTVHNWIDTAKRGKVNLKLYKTSNRTYIADTAENTLVLQKLATKGKKFRNTLHHKTIRPNPNFYEIYNHRHILDIITNLSVHREIPREYNYFEEGAVNWDKWLRHLAAEEASNILKGTVELISINTEALDRLLEGAKKVNVIDLGVGNAHPVKELLHHLIEKQLLHRYIGIDISTAMLSIAERNVKEWFGDKINFEGHVRDISYDHFDDLLVDDMVGKDAEETINLVLLLGMTPSNIRSFTDAFKAAYSSMNSNDLLLYVTKPDTEASRQYLDFNPVPGESKLSPNHKYVLDLMNIDESFYDVEMGFDVKQRMRYVRVRLKTAITIDFSYGQIDRAVSFEKGDTILLLRVWHLTAIENIAELEKIGLKSLQFSLTKDQQYLLTISGVEVNKNS